MQQTMTRPNSQQHLLDTSIDSTYQLFLLDRKVQRLSPHTIRFYSTHLNPFTEWCRTEHQLEKLGDIASAHIRAYLLLLYERDLSSYSVHAVARSLRAFFNFCVQEGLIAVTPMARIKMPKLDRTILPAFEDADIRKLLQACVETRERAIVLVLLDTGCRASERQYLALVESDLQRSHDRYGAVDNMGGAT